MAEIIEYVESGIEDVGHIRRALEALPGQLTSEALRIQADGKPHRLCFTLEWTVLDNSGNDNPILDWCCDMRASYVATVIRDRFSPNRLLVTQLRTRSFRTGPWYYEGNDRYEVWEAEQIRNHEVPQRSA
jgi:hypothetical protein